jgi:hypothetical protein
VRERERDRERVKGEREREGGREGGREIFSNYNSVSIRKGSSKDRKNI